MLEMLEILFTNDIGKFTYPHFGQKFLHLLKLVSSFPDSKMIT